MITDYDIFAYETMVWQYSTEGHKDWFQSNFVTHTLGGVCDSSRRKL